MNKQVRIRLGKALIVLALVFGMVGLLGKPAEAHYAAPCYYYAGCEYCACMEYRCGLREEIPECGGNAACCSSAVSGCWRYCIWY